KDEISAIKNDQASMKDEISAIKNDQASMKDEISAMKDDQMTMKLQLDENTEITKAIHHRQDESDAKLEGLSLNFAKLHGEVVAVKEGINQLSNDQQSINELLGEHEVSIRSLRRNII